MNNIMHDNLSDEEIIEFINNRINTNYVLLNNPRFSFTLGINYTMIQEEMHYLLNIKNSIEEKRTI